MDLTVKITPRVAAGVARRLRLAASVRSRSMSAMVNDALDEVLPSLEEIRRQLAAPAAGEPGAGRGDRLSHAGPVTVTAARGGPAVPALGKGRAMTAFAEDRARRWEPFGVTEADFAAAPERDGVRVVNVTSAADGQRAGAGGCAPPPSRWACWPPRRRR